MALGLIVGVICGIICAAVASSKGRNPVGWFFVGFLIGIFGLILVLVVSNVKEEKARQTFMEQENHRLREQIRQEQIKSESFRAHAQRRLDAHDQTLGLDTRADRTLEGPAPVAGYIESQQSDAPAVGATGWYYSMGGQNFGPLPWGNMAQMFQLGAIPRNVLVWTEGMTDWAPAERVPAFNALVNT